MPVTDKTDIILQELVKRTNDINRRVRSLEDKIQIQENRTKSLEETSLEKIRKINSKFTEADAILKSLSDDVTKIKNNMDKMNKQAVRYAMKKDVKELETMLDLLNPDNAMQKDNNTSE
ncbi:MAG: hypothetical protein V1900_00050 [Candidatus Aenigmatarchaeota archaeon]